MQATRPKYSNESNEKSIEENKDLNDDKELQSKSERMKELIEEARILNMLYGTLPDIFNKYPASDLENSYVEKIRHELNYDYMDKMLTNEHHIITMIEFMDDVNSLPLKAKDNMLHSLLNKIKYPQIYLYFIAIKTCMEVCKHISTKGME